MLLKNISNCYNLLLALGAFYLGIQMILARGAFDSWPPEWIGKLPFTSWASLALFGMIVFGIGNAFSSIWGFIKKDQKVFLMTFTMGALFFFCTVISTILVGEWYLPTSGFLLFSTIQLLLGLVGFVISYFTNKAVGRKITQ